MRILVTGDRNWTDRETIRDALTMLLETAGSLTVIHGGATGADRIAGEEAKALGCEVLEFKANWALYGKAAGPKRNQQMLDEGKPEYALAFHHDLNSSRGTLDMVRRLKKAKIPYTLHGNLE